MGTETSIILVAFHQIIRCWVKLNNPQMGTETMVCIDTHLSEAKHSLN